MDFDTIKAQLQNAEKKMTEHNVIGTLTLFGSARIVEDDKVYKKTREVSKAISEAFPQYHICTGGGGGLMKAGNEGASTKSIGMGITLPFEQNMNEFVDIEIPFEHFFTRKYWMIHSAKAVICFKGGVGTFDEFFETITLIQTKKIEKIPIILVGKDFWDKTINFEYMIEEGLVSDSDNGLFLITDDTNEIVQYLKDNIS